MVLLQTSCGAKSFGNLMGTHCEQQNKNPPGPQNPKEKKNWSSLVHLLHEMFMFKIVCHRFQLGIIPLLKNVGTYSTFINICP